VSFSILLIYLVGAKSQYYPLSPPESEELPVNSERPAFDIFDVPIRTLEDYWSFIERLAAANLRGNKTQYAAIV
jgi:hypothetical protein